MGYQLFTMGEVQAYFDSGEVDYADFAGERLEELRTKYANKRQTKNAAAIREEPTQKQRNALAKRSQNRQANKKAGLGTSGQRRGYFKTVKGKKVFVRGGAVMTKRSAKGVISKQVIDRGATGLRGELRKLTAAGNKFTGKNKLGQLAVNTASRGASKVLAYPGRAGAIGAGIAAAGGGAYYLSNRD